MPDVEINGTTVTIERFRLDKAMRVITLLKLLQQQAPEVSKAWAAFRKEYAEEYATDLDRNHALAMFPRLRDSLTEEDWERAGQKHRIPGAPNTYEVFFEMAPVVYDKAEKVTLRLLGLIAMPNDLVSQYVKEDDIWKRVDEFVDETIRSADLDEILELVLTAAEVIDGQVLQKARSAGERVGNVLRLFGWKTTTTTSETSGTSSGSPEQPSSSTSTGSPSDTSGTPTGSELSTGATSSPSSTGSLQTA